MYLNIAIVGIANIVKYFSFHFDQSIIEEMYQFQVQSKSSCHNCDASEYNWDFLNAWRHFCKHHVNRTGCWQNIFFTLGFGDVVVSSFQPNKVLIVAS